jgi:deazaflavin-dependent oxidoreductase (nitroreductase family)
MNRRVIDAYRARDGRVDFLPGGGARMLLLTTTGARSHEPRTAPMMYVADGDRLVVFASNAGAARPPAWYVNLVAYPNGVVEVGGERFEVTARTAAGEERERLWRLFPFPDHEAKAGREIPVVVLHRRAN